MKIIKLSVRFIFYIERGIIALIHTLSDYTFLLMIKTKKYLKKIAKANKNQIRVDFFFFFFFFFDGVEMQVFCASGCKGMHVWGREVSSGVALVCPLELPF